MWRTILAVFLFLATIVGAFFVYNYTVELCDDLAAALPMVYSDDSFEKVEQLSLRFEKYQPLLSTFYVHDSIAQVNSAFVRCLGYASHQNLEGYEIEISLLSRLIHDLPRSDSPNIENIL